MKNIKNIKWKEFMLEKGERVGLAAAGGLVLLLLALTLFRPGKGLFSGSSKAHAKELNDMSAKLKTAQDNARPQDRHKPGPVGNVTKTYLVKRVDPAQYPTQLAFSPSVEKDRKRQRPEVLVPDELQVQFFRAQLPHIVFGPPDEEGKITKVWVLKNAPGGDAGQPNMPAGMKGAGDLQGTLNRGGSMGRYGTPGRPGGRGGQRNLGNLRSGFGRRGQKPLDLTDKIELVDIAAAEQRVLATEALGTRMVLVEASFPYKKQVQEFMDKLRLTSHGAVLTELVKDKDAQGKDETRPSFAFRGMVIERTTLDRNGKEGAWQRLMGTPDPKEKVEQPFDLGQVYKELVVQLDPRKDKRFEKEDPKLQPILDASVGLVMKVPAQYEPRKAPKLEKKLVKIQETIKKLEASGKKPEDVTPSLLRREDPFGLGTEGQKNTGSTPPPPPDQGRGFGNIPGKSTLKETPIDSCLIRFIDPLVEGGKTYKYRIKVKMANPNYSPEPEQRTDTYPHFAQAKELVAAKWATTPPVTVPADEFVYAVDQARVAPKLRVGFSNTPRDYQAVFQIQRWVDSYPSSGDKEQNLGDWLVAARFFVDRGEYVRTPPSFTLEVPVHRLDNPQLTRDNRPALRRGDRTTQMPVSFGDESILVDFEGDRERGVYIRTETEGEKTKTTRIEDKGATEVLIMRPDGRMIAHTYLADSADPVRQKRYKDYLDRVEEATNGKKKERGFE